MNKGRLAVADRERLRELERCRRSLWYLATGYLGYGWDPSVKAGIFRGNGLTRRLHYWICEWYDAQRDAPFLGLWLQRFGLKTTLTISLMVQEVLRYPDVAMRYWHNVDAEAEKVVYECGMHFVENERLRSLDPIGFEKDGVTPRRYMPRRSEKRWLRSSRFILSRGKKRRWPTLEGSGVMSETTGSHCDVAFLDDIIALRTILNSELGKVKSIFENTIMPVVDGMKIRVTGTPWSADGLYRDWWEDPDWRTRKIPGNVRSEESLEVLRDVESRKVHIPPHYDADGRGVSSGVATFGPLEYQGSAKKRLAVLQRQMKGHFPAQIQVDPVPPAEMAWKRDECFRVCTLRGDGTSRDPGVRGEGEIFVLSDPAPWLLGGVDGEGEKVRDDGTKDYWALCVVKLRNRGLVQDVIVLDGIASQEWDHQTGMDEAARLMKRWRTPYLFTEAEKEMRKYAVRACQKLGLVLYLEQGMLPRFQNYNKRDRKNAMFLSFAGKARDGEVWFCEETIPEEFLWGDRERIGVCPQLEHWRRTGARGTGLRFDDHGDVVCRSVDGKLQEIYPAPDPEFEEDEARRRADRLLERDGGVGRCRYVPFV